MDKIASPKELTAEIRSLLAYAEGKEPSRVRLAADLSALAKRVAAGKSSSGGQDIFHSIVPQRDVMKMYDRLSDEDEQTAELYVKTVQKLTKMLDLPRGAQEALRRIQDVSDRGQRWDMGLLRNNIFKAADAVGIHLPSASF